MCAKALGAEHTPLYYLVVATPVLALLERIPISISTIGIREGLMVALLAPLGVPVAEAIAIALMLRAAETTQILLMIFVWYIDNSPTPSDEEL